MRTAAAMVALTSLAFMACQNDPGRASTTTTTGAAIDEPTALHQSNDPRDVAIVRDLRTRLTADQTLSAPAKNAVVIVRDGVVTLRADGVAAADRARLLEHVAQVPGVVRVDDRLGTRE